MFKQTYLASLLAGFSILACAATPSTVLAKQKTTPDKATLYIGWRAEAEFGGFFQALADGTYKKHGLDVQIVLGSPQSNPTQMLLAGRADFSTGSSGSALNAVREEAPLVTVAAMFQKDPRILIAHPGQGIKNFEDIKQHTVLVGALGKATFWSYLKKRYGFTEEQTRPYTFSLAPFLADKSLVQQGYATNEPYAVEHAGIKNPVTFLLADYGYDPYAVTLATIQKTVKQRPDYVQRFVDASKEGWHNYLYKDPSLGNADIKKRNPDMTDGELNFAIKTIRELELVTGRDATEKGIGAMTDNRWKEFYASMTESGVLPEGLDVNKAYTLQFVNKGPLKE